MSDLQLTPWEEVMLHQDSTAYPCAIVVRLNFQGRVSRDPFERALRAALVRHPLLSSRVERNHRILRWLPVEQQDLRVEWRDGCVQDGYPSMPYLDIQREGMRVLVIRGEAETNVLVQAHHACCDGLGLYQFIQDVLVLYAVDTGPGTAPAPLEELRPADLKQRGKLGLNAGTLARMLPRQLVGLHGVAKFLMHAPVPVVPHQRVPSETPTAAAYPAATAYRFDTQTSQALGNAARHRNVTTNELLCSCLFEALHAFRTQKDVADDHHWLRLMIPMSLRRAEDSSLPAANLVSAIFLDRQAKSICQPDQLLASIHEEMQVIKQNQLGFTFLFSINAQRLFPGGIRKGARQRGERCNASAVFTNVGRVLSKTPLAWHEGRLCCGDVFLAQAEMLAPLTAYTCAAFGASWFADRLAITLHYDPRPLSSDDAQCMLSEFVTRIDAAASTAPHLPFDAAGHRSARHLRRETSKRTGKS